MKQTELATRNGEMVLAGFKLSRCGLVADGSPEFEAWQQVGQYLSHVDGAVHWWIGDWLNYGERAYGEKYAQAIDATGFEYQTVANDKWVATQLELSRRRENVPFSHHAEVAALPPKQQDKLLKQAEKEEWTRKEIREHVREAKQEQAIEEAGQFAIAGYRVLYADPPWEYFDQRTGGIESGAAAAHYPALPTEKICSLADSTGKTVREVAAKEAALFLWATAPCLPDALRVMAAWGFDYKAQFVWDKVRGFNGHYNDVQHELLLIGLRGSFPPKGEQLHKSIVTQEKTKHSRKPEVFYEIIEALYPDGARLELFARGKRYGWDAWGNEA